MARPVASSSRRRLPAGFTLIELLVVLCMLGALLAIGIPQLLKIVARYKVHSSAQQLEMLGRQARFESIKLGQPVTLVADTNRNAFYVFSGTLGGMPPYKLPDGYGDIPALQRVTSWQLPTGISFAMVPAASCVAGSYCQSFSFNSDGSGTGQPVVISTPGQPTWTIAMKAQATGKLTITSP